MADPIRQALERLQQYAAAHPEHDTAELVAAARAALAAERPAPAEPDTDADPIRQALESLLAAEAYIHVAGPEYVQARDAAYAALAAKPPAPAPPLLCEPPVPAVPDEVGEAFAELERRQENLHCFRDLRKDLAAEPPAPDPREALAARPLLEAVARLGDRIGQHTVAEITTISDRAAAWLAENPPGQPVAIEPRGCPTPGACSCVEPPAPADPDTDAVLALAAIIRRVNGWHSLGAAALAEAILAHPNAASVFQPPAPAPAADGERKELAADLDECADSCVLAEKHNWAQQMRRAAALLREARPQPVPVADRPWERPGWCDAEGRCWWGRCADDFFSPEWTMATLANIEEFCSDAMPQHCLPHWAIPQPPQGGEVE